MPRSKTKKSLICIEPIPTSSIYDSEIISFTSTSQAFKNFRKEWVITITKKKERLGGYICKKNVSKYCITDIKNRKTLESMKSMFNKEHYKAHNNDKNAFSQYSEFVYITQPCEMENANDETHMKMEMKRLK